MYSSELTVSFYISPWDHLYTGWYSHHPFVPNVRRNAWHDRSFVPNWTCAENFGATADLRRTCWWKPYFFQSGTNAHPSEEQKTIWFAHQLQDSTEGPRVSKCLSIISPVISALKKRKCRGNFELNWDRKRGILTWFFNSKTAICSVRNEQDNPLADVPGATISPSWDFPPKILVTFFEVSWESKKGV